MSEPINLPSWLPFMLADFKYTQKEVEAIVRGLNLMLNQGFWVTYNRLLQTHPKHYNKIAQIALLRSSFAVVDKRFENGKPYLPSWHSFLQKANEQAKLDGTEPITFSSLEKKNEVPT